MTIMEDSRTGMSLEEQHGSPPVWGRLIVGLFYGLLLATLYGVMSQVIDLIAMKDVPLAIDWNRATTYIVITCLGGLALGAIVAWPLEGWKGTLFGAAAIVAWSLIQSFLLLGFALLVFLPFVLPFIFLSLPISGAVRLAVNLHENALHKSGWKRWRNLVLVLAGTVGLGLLAGSWAQMPPHAQEAVRTVNRVLQYAKANPDRSLSVTLRDVPEIVEHLNSQYVMNQTPVDSSPTGVEVNVTFEDGFAISCLIGQEGDMPYCQRGHNVFSNPGGRPSPLKPIRILES